MARAAVRGGLLLALGATLAAAQDVRGARALAEPAPWEPPPPRPAPEARPRLALVPPPPPEPEPAPEPAVAPRLETDAPPVEAPVRSGRRRARRVAAALLVGAALAAWLWFFLPQSLGGRAGWVLVSGKSMLPHLRTGDLVLVERQSSYHVGEVVAYHVPQGDPMAGAQVIHRIVGGDARHGFVVQGDNRTAPDVWRPTPKDIVGAEVLRVPDAIVVLQWLRSPLLLGLLAASFVLVHVLVRGGDGRAEQRA